MHLLARAAAATLCALFVLVDHASARTIPGGTRPSRRAVQTQARELPRTNAARYLTINTVTLSQAYENADYGVRINYPAKWELQEILQQDGALTLVMMFLSPKDTATKGLRENVNLVVEELPHAAYTLDEYTKLALEQEKEFFDIFTLLREDRVKLGRFTAHQVEFTAVVDGRSVAYRQVWFLKNKKAYVWTFADEPSMFGKHIATFERMLDTVRLD